MSRLHKVEAVVKEVLTEVPETRGDDFLLIAHTYARFNPEVLTMPFKDVMVNHKDLGIPYFESVRRARPKLQNKYPELKASSKVEQARLEKQEEYLEYVRE